MRPASVSHVFLVPTSCETSDTWKMCSEYFRVVAAAGVIGCLGDGRDHARGCGHVNMLGV